MPLCKANWRALSPTTESRAPAEFQSCPVNPQKHPALQETVRRKSTRSLTASYSSLPKRYIATPSRPPRPPTAPAPAASPTSPPQPGGLCPSLPLPVPPRSCSSSLRAAGEALPGAPRRRGPGSGSGPGPGSRSGSGPGRPGELLPPVRRRLAPRPRPVEGQSPPGPAVVRAEPSGRWRRGGRGRGERGEVKQSEVKRSEANRPVSHSDCLKSQEVEIRSGFPSSPKGCSESSEGSAESLGGICPAVSLIKKKKKNHSRIVFRCYVSLHRFLLLINPRLLC